jgi:hypothetical protein
VSQYRQGRVAGVIVPRSAASAASAPRRRSSFARLVGAVGLVTLTAVLFWLLTDESFRVTEASVDFDGLRHADEAEVRAHLTDLDRAPNVFRVRASDIVSELSTLTEVDAASATVTMPAGVSVHLDERDPVFIWSDGDKAWLVDDEGMLFAPGEPFKTTAAPAAGNDDAADEAADEDPDTEVGTPDDEDPGEPSEPVDAAARAALPVVEDARLVTPPAVGTYLPAVDLAVMRQLLAVTPELLESRSQSLHLRVDERDGYVLESQDRGWRAIFGHYTPSAQPPDVISRQVQCLSWLLASEEKQLDHVRLALSDTACGTYTTLESKKDKKN